MRARSVLRSSFMLAGSACFVAACFDLAGLNAAPPVADEGGAPDAADARDGAVVLTTSDATLVPSEGVYVYDGVGHEMIRFQKDGAAPLEAGQGPTMTASVTYFDAGCWSFSIRVGVKHAEALDLCVHDGGLYEYAEKDDQASFFIANVATSRCDDPQPNAYLEPQMTLGASVKHFCSGTNSAVKGSFSSGGSHEWKGIEAVTIEGKPVTAYHLVNRRQVNGTQNGTVITEWWLATDDALPLKGTRAVSVFSPMDPGVQPLTGPAIDYVESSSWTLRARTPGDAGVDAAEGGAKDGG